MKKLLLAAVSQAALLSATPSHAAIIWAASEPCPDWKGVCRVIHIEGEVLLNDWKLFEQASSGNTAFPTVVQLDSPGGNVFSGLMIGRRIQYGNYSTYVVNTDCASICAAIWVAGKTRYVGPKSRVGFHQVYWQDSRGRIVRDQITNQLVKEYYLEIGVPKPAADFFVSAAPEDIYWLNDDLAKGLSIQYTWVDPSALVVPNITTVEVAPTPPQSLQ